MSTTDDSEILEAQMQEFDALHRLCEAYNQLPTVADGNGNSEARRQYEDAMDAFIMAIANNGRITVI